MRKKTGIAVVVCTFLLTTVISYVAASAQGAEPGSTADPIVTKSYVDQKLNEVMSLIANSATTTTTPTSTNNTGTPTQALPDGASYDDEQLLLLIDFLLTQKLQDSVISSDSFAPVSVPAGKTIVASSDGLELILRSGKSAVYAGENGLTDVTSGQDIGNGTAIVTNHLLICGRSGRGAKATTDTWFMAKGGYVILD